MQTGTNNNDNFTISWLDASDSYAGLAGSDTAHFSGYREEYKVKRWDDRIEVTNKTNGVLSTLYDVETLAFWDATEYQNPLRLYSNPLLITEIEAGDTYTDAQWLAWAAGRDWAIAGRIESSSDRDFYRFTVAETTEIEYLLANQSANVSTRLFRELGWGKALPGARWYAWESGGAQEYNYVNVLEPGEYVLEVWGVGDAVSDYELSIGTSASQGFSQSSAVNLGNIDNAGFDYIRGEIVPQTFAGAFKIEGAFIGKRNDEDWYSFETNGGTYDLLTGINATDAYMLDDALAPVSENNLGTYDLAAGSYYLRLDADSPYLRQGSLNQYELIMQEVAPPPNAMTLGETEYRDEIPMFLAPLELAVEM